MQKIARYTGEIINGREDIRELVNKLSSSNSSIARGFFKLASLKSKQVTLTALTPNEAKRYECFGVINQRAKLQMRANAFRHLLNSGHIGGKKKNGGIDSKPLSIKDIEDIRSVYKNPDKIYRRDSKIVAEKNIRRRHCLVLEIKNRGQHLSLKTYYNKSKKPPK